MIPAIRRAPGDFFFDLPPLVDGVSDLWKYLNGLGPSVHILSAPIESNEDTTTKKSEPVPIEGDEKEPATTSATGKRNWVKKYLEKNPPVSVITAAADEKQKWAIDEVSGLPNLLVDDKEKTIKQWNARGGIGILHIPGDSASSIKRIKNLGI